MKALLTGLLIIFLAAGNSAVAADNGPVVGIGVRIHSVDKQPVIDQVIPDGPAFKGGVKPGDRLVKINGTSVQGLSLAEVSKLLQGAAKSRVKVVVLRAGETGPRTFSLRREMLTLPGSSLPSPP